MQTEKLSNENDTSNGILADVSNRAWNMAKDLKESQLWVSQWWCDDGDGVELYIDKDNGGFELNCFSGIPASKIYIDIVDFGTLWRKAYNDLAIYQFDYYKQCQMLANWLCNMFCEWKNVTEYTQK
jgi:hypothetical protein